jgi:hypothetical protein
MRPISSQRPLVAAASALLIATLGACGGAGDGARGAGGGVRDTLPDGTPIIRYARLDADEAVDLVTPDLRIGSLDGEGPDVFGDVRGIEAGPDGSIYVLDHHAAEIRVFDTDGAHLRTIARRGQGPGEIGESNGFVLVGDTLFVHDHSKWQMLGLSTSGGELVRYDLPVRSYAYLWSGVRDDRGRYWKLTSHSDDDEPRVYPPEPGLAEGSSRGYMKVYDPATEQHDSVRLGDVTGRSWVTVYGNGASYRSIPFDPSQQIIADPGGGFWRTNTDAYRIARIDEAGDTVLILDAGVAPRPVSDADREAFSESMGDTPENARAAAEILAIAPTTLPVLHALSVDPAGRLWVRRHTTTGERTRFDVFTRDGEYLGSLQLDFETSSYFAPKIRGSNLYTLVQDEFDVPYVVRAPLPEWAAVPSGGP